MNHSQYKTFLLKLRNKEYNQNNICTWLKQKKKQ